jgi:phosphoribosylformylglycinamidine synthase subunit PurQ / glutaminase
MNTRVAIVVFPGSNCDQDCARSFMRLGADPVYVWHAETSLPDAPIVVLPGGFAHGDYLRTGALARFSPVMQAVRKHAEDGGLLIGICNGFQVLCEAGLLPGALRKNAGLKFLCRWTELSVANNQTPFSTRARAGQILRIPINHFEGNWHASKETFEDVLANDQVVLRYTSNPNGSLDDVAGIVNKERNVLGLMPHPERACDALLGSEDGSLILGSTLDHAGSSDVVVEGSSVMNRDSPVPT